LCSHYSTLDRSLATCRNLNHMPLDATGVLGIVRTYNLDLDVVYDNGPCQLPLHKEVIGIMVEYNILSQLIQVGVGKGLSNIYRVLQRMNIGITKLGY
jgi:hypothetical protein